jgi:hypothetical protein
VIKTSGTGAPDSSKCKISGGGDTLIPIPLSSLSLPPNAHFPHFHTPFSIPSHRPTPSTYSLSAISDPSSLSMLVPIRYRPPSTIHHQIIHPDLPSMRLTRSLHCTASKRNIWSGLLRSSNSIPIRSDIYIVSFCSYIRAYVRICVHYLVVAIIISPNMVILL